MERDSKDLQLLPSTSGRPNTDGNGTIPDGSTPIKTWITGGIKRETSRIGGRR